MEVLVFFVPSILVKMKNFALNFYFLKKDLAIKKKFQGVTIGIWDRRTTNMTKNEVFETQFFSKFNFAAEEPINRRPKNAKFNNFFENFSNFFGPNGRK